MLTLPFILAIGYGLGFVWFLRMTGESPDLPARADAITVLTGGPERIETGLRLLLAGHAPILLVSGIGGKATVQDLARRAGVDATALAGRVTLGHNATTTRTNAVETVPFVQAHYVHDLIVVTAGYHMPRALVELGRALPNVVLHPAPVLPGRGAARTPSWRLLMEEYTKWLVAAIGLSGYAPAHAPRQNPAGETAPAKNGAIMLRDGRPV